MILWEMEKCRKYEDYIKLLDIYGNYLTTVNPGVRSIGQDVKR